VSFFFGLEREKKISRQKFFLSHTLFFDVALEGTYEIFCVFLSLRRAEEERNVEKNLRHFFAFF